MRYLDVCAGISASTVAWKPLGWEAAAYSEIEPAPRAVLAQHYPDTPLHGDFTTIEGNEYGPVDLLVGGTPCQSFSIAGLRLGMADSRGNLALEYARLASRLRARWLVWENVRGVLSADGGRAFGSILGALAELGYGFAYRVLDAQYFGVPQRRARVILVGYLGDWRPAAAVLFERESLSGISAPDYDHTVSDVDWWAGKGRALNCIDAGYGSKWGSNQWYARGHTIIGLDGRPRRATVTEVERAFGFPDGYTNVLHRGKPMADRHRYKCLGNSMAPPKMRWVGERIAAVDHLALPSAIAA
jgi:DNA (cytosine-5)-methyltransferase 1